MQGGAISWQNVQFVKKVFIMEIMSAILIEDQIMFGSQTLRRFLAFYLLSYMILILLVVLFIVYLYIVEIKVIIFSL